MSFIPEFDEENHIYTVDGVVLPSVNGILTGTGICDYSGIPDENREWYFTRGKHVHTAMEHLIDGTLRWDTVNDTIRGYVQAGERFLRETGFEPIVTEMSMYHPQWKYAGTPDAIGKLNRRMVVVDWKSGKVMDHVKLQTAAYAELFRVCGIGDPVERYGVELKSNGTYKMTDAWMSSTDLAKFLNYLTTYNDQVVRIDNGLVVKA